MSVLDLTEAQLTAELRDVAQKLCNVSDPFQDGWTVVEQARGTALRISRFYADYLLGSSPPPSDHFLLVTYLFRRLFNDTWKLFAGDSGVHVGRGIEDVAEFREGLRDVLQLIGRFLLQGLQSEEQIALGTATKTYQEALSSYYRVARACEVFLTS